MSSNNPIQVTGFPYLWSYSGGLHILEEFLGITLIVFIALCGFSLSAKLFFGAALLATIHTLVFMILYIKGTIRKSKLPWHWIQVTSTLSVALTLSISSSIILSALTRGYVLTGVLGYVTSLVYFFDTYHKYQIAITPVPKYAWTTPNMPDLN